MELVHFSHEHPIKVTKIDVRSDDDDKAKCRMCGAPILGDTTAYVCIKEGCDFYLHKRCAELPKDINPPLHDCKNSLTLSLIRWELRGPCNSCHKGHKYSYACTDCEFQMCIPCSIDDGRVVEHAGHHHPLTLLNKSATLHCSACDTEAKDDLSYLCTACRFWIHKSCFQSPTSLKINHHDHTLDLAYSLPLQYRKFKLNCNLCHKRVFPSYWLYWCGRCTYTVHLKCAVMPRDGEGENIDEDELDPNPVHFPLQEETMDLISKFLKAISTESGGRRVSNLIHHASARHHPSSTINSSNIDKWKLRCDSCMKFQPSNCLFCHFRILNVCDHIPQTFTHPYHSKNPHLSSVSHEFSFHFKCSVCKVRCSGFKFEFNNARVDEVCVCCASAPRTIRHKAHKHTLRLKIISSDSICDACGERLSNFKYECKACQYQVHNYCARLSDEVKHDWDHHPLKLIYPPFDKTPDDIFCEICEEFIHPKYWRYHCRGCDQSFHIKCLGPDDRYLDITLGGTLRVKNHPDPLNYVLKGNQKSPFHCNACGKLEDDYPGFKCEACDFHLCLDCGESNVVEELV